MEVPEIPGAELRDRLNNGIAVSVSILAAFMAVTKVKDDNIVQAMQKAQSNEVDRWSQYQAKGVKLNLAEMGHNQAELAQLSAANPEALEKLKQIDAAYQKAIAHYKEEQIKLKDLATGYHSEYDELNFRDDQFDISDAALSVAMALLAVTALTRKIWLLWVTMVFAALGMTMGLAGLCGWRIHPEWLTRLLG